MPTLENDPTTSPRIMSMHPSGGIRRSKSTSVTICQQTATQGASAGGGGRSSYRTPGPPRKTACCLGTPGFLSERGHVGVRSR